MGGDSVRSRAMSGGVPWSRKHDKNLRERGGIEIGKREGGGVRGYGLTANHWYTNCFLLFFSFLFPIENTNNHDFTSFVLNTEEVDESLCESSDKQERRSTSVWSTHLTSNGGSDLTASK
ncbi:hypothetical protein BaRGS_00030916 [Batillaria attramentaria]|uniref:Uncharacterized protein n=1 Tax=Batillaria attramentaria TaxID=370345 RepID=A0ABD0JTL8_9CAEN